MVSGWLIYLQQPAMAKASKETFNDRIIPASTGIIHRWPQAFLS
jgi:hypothetical protein